MVYFFWVNQDICVVKRPIKYHVFFVFVCLPPEFLPVAGLLTRWCASTLGAALLCNSRVGSWLGAYIQTWGWGLCQLVSSSQVASVVGFLAIPFFFTLLTLTTCLHPPTKIPVLHDQLSQVYNCTNDVIQVVLFHATFWKIYTHVYYCGYEPLESWSRWCLQFSSIVHFFFCHIH